MNTLWKGVLWVVGIALVAWGAYGLVGKKPADQAASEPVKVGFISAQTGVGVAVGAEELKGARLAVIEANAAGGINGRPIELVAEDLSLDKLKNATAVTSKLINIDKVIAIVGPQWDEPAAAIIPAIDAAKIPTISQNSTSDVETALSSDYFFSAWPDNRVGIESLLEFAEERNLKNVAIIRLLDGGFWQFTRNLFVEGAPKHGITVVSDENVGNPLATDFRTVIAKTKVKKPDAVFIVFSEVSECAFLKQAKELGLDVPVLSTESAGNNASLAQCPSLLGNLHFSAPRQTAAYGTFAAAFKGEFDTLPEFPSAATAYDAVRVVIQAIKDADMQGGAVLRDAIANIKDYPGTFIPQISFSKEGFVITPSDTYAMQTVRDGKFTQE